MKKTGDSRHETLDRAEDLWVVDQLWKHVGIVVHHLPDNNRKYSLAVVRTSDRRLNLSKVYSNCYNLVTFFGNTKCLGVLKCLIKCHVTEALH